MTPPTSESSERFPAKRFERRLCRRNFSWGEVRKGGEAPLRGIFTRLVFDLMYMGRRRLQTLSI